MTELAEPNTAVATIDLKVNCWTLEGVASPLFIDCKSWTGDTDRFLSWVAQHRPELDDLILQHGGVVLKDSPLRTAEQFDALTSLFPSFERGYVGGSAPRARVVGKVMESTRMAPEFKLNLHQEMAYLPDYPARIAFFCKKAAEHGGETIIGSMREFTKRVPEKICRKIEAHGVRGVRNYAPAGSSKGTARHTDDLSWDETFGTTSQDEVTAICAEMNMEAHWNPDGSLTVVNYTDGFATHPKTGERFYRSILHANYLIYEKYQDDVKTLVDEVRTRQKYPTGYRLGNGEPLSREESRALEQAFDEVTVSWPWAVGDVMILDNLQTAHGRNPFSGSRETLVALLN